nr:transporter [uncultured bacterium]
MRRGYPEYFSCSAEKTPPIYVLTRYPLIRVRCATATRPGHGPLELPGSLHGYSTDTPGKGLIGMKNNSVFAQPGFLRLLIGVSISLLGDQFTMIATPWLVFKMTKDGLVLATVMALVGLPRVVFLLFAGALVDRYSPRAMLIISSLIGAALLCILGVLVLTESLTTPVLYVFALAMGLVGAFAIPARMAILPRVVPAQHLQAANSAVMGISQISILLGPVLAGLLINTTQGLGVAFLVDALCFLVAALTVPRLAIAATAMIDEGKHMLRSILDGLKWLWSDRTLRLLTVYWTIAVLLASGPIQVGLPILVEQQLGMGSAAFGILISANGFGQLAGIVLSGLRLAKAVPLGIAVCLIDFVAGLAMLGIGVNHVLIVAVALLFTLGVGAGFVQVGLYTWIQRRIPDGMLGRIISILTLVMTAIAPLSALLTGVLTKYVPMAGLFVVGGISLSCFALLSMLSPTIRGVRTAYET